MSAGGTKPALLLQKRAACVGSLCILSFLLPLVVVVVLAAVAAIGKGWCREVGWSLTQGSAKKWVGRGPKAEGQLRPP